MLKYFCILIIAITLTACETPTPRSNFLPQRILLDGTYTHKESKFEFPDKIGGFSRASITKYDENEYDVGIGYNAVINGAPIIATVFIYPSPSLTSIGSPDYVIYGARKTLCGQVFNQSRNELTSSHPDAQSIRIEEQEKLSKTPQKTEVFKLTGNIAGVETRLSSILDVSCYNNDYWNIKFRVTHPEAINIDSEFNNFKNSIKKSGS